MIEYASIWSQEPTKQIPQLFIVRKLGKRPRPFPKKPKNQIFLIQSQTKHVGYQKKRSDALVSENIVITLFPSLVTRYLRFSQNMRIFSFNFVVRRKPALPLGMCFATFFSLRFLLVYTLGHNELIGYTPNSAPFGLRAPKNIFFGKAAGEIIQL